MQRVFSFDTTYLWLALWGAGLVAVLCALPVVPALAPLFGVGALCALSLAGLARWWAQPEPLPLGALAGLLCAVFGVALLSAVLSDISFNGFIFAMVLGALPLSYVGCAFAPRPDAFFKMIAAGFIVICTLIAGFALYHYGFAPAYLYKGQAHLPMRNPNALAAFLSLGFFVTCGAWLKTCDMRLRFLLWLSLFLIFAALLLTGSRGAAICALLAYGVLCWGLSGVKKEELWRLHGGVFAAMAVPFTVLSIFASSHAAHRNPSGMITQTLRDPSGVLNERTEIWQATWAMIQDHIFTGVGPGNFVHYYPAYRLADFSSAGYMAHNELLQFWAELGLFGPALLLLMVVYVLTKTLQALRGSEIFEDRLAILVPFCALGAVFVHAQISFPFHILPVLYVMGALFAFWQWRICRGGASVLMRGSKIVAGGGIVVLGVLWLAFTPLQLSEFYAAQAQSALMRGDMEGFARKVNRAGDLSARLNPGVLRLAADVPVGLIETRDSDIGLALIYGQAQQSAAQKQALFDQAQSLLARAQHLNPRMASTYRDQARILIFAHEEGLRAGALEEETPRALLEKALVLNPLDIKARMFLASLLSDDGQDDAAYALLKAGMPYPYLDIVGVPYYDHISRLALARGDQEILGAAVQKIQSAKQRQERAQQP